MIVIKGTPAESDRKFRNGDGGLLRCHDRNKNM